MNQDLISVMMPVIATVVQWLIFLYLYRDNREPFLWWWNLGWGCYALSWGWQGLAAVTHEALLWTLWRDLSGGLAAFFACVSGLAFQRRGPLRTAQQVGLGCYGGLIVLGTTLPYVWGAGPMLVSLTIGSAYVVSGLLFLVPWSGHTMKGVPLLASAQMLRGLLLVGRLYFVRSSALWQGFMTVGTILHQLAVMGMIILVLEYSKQRALELKSRLAQAERLAVLGEFSAGVAHEIRNPLGAIVNAVAALNSGDQEFSPEDRHTLVEVVKREAGRLNRLLTEFIQFTKPRQPQRVVGNINILLAEIAALLRRDASTTAGITIREELAPNLPMTGFDADQLRQAIWNIAKNGVESMTAGQELVMTSQRCDDEILIGIHDTGGGIASGEVPHIFRPFYSRKAGGTGLGLAIAAGVVEAHQGSIEVKSQLGAGTAFVVHLPVTQGV
jgi:signal transduction histidine kinase